MSDDDALTWLSKLRSASDPLAALSSLKKETIDNSPIATSRRPPVLNPAPTTPYPNLEMRLSLQHPQLYPSTPLYGHSVSSSRPSKDAFNEALDDGSELEVKYAVPALDRFTRYMMLMSHFSIRGYATEMTPRSKALSGEVEWQAVLCDARLRQLKISHWSPVVISDELAAQLLSLYLTTDHPLLSPFDADLFIDDLTSRTLRFCSPLLVNSVLAWACVSILPLFSNCCEGYLTIDQDHLQHIDRTSGRSGRQVHYRRRNAFEIRREQCNRAQRGIPFLPDIGQYLLGYGHVGDAIPQTNPRNGHFAKTPWRELCDYLAIRSFPSPLDQSVWVRGVGFVQFRMVWTWSRSSISQLTCEVYICRITALQNSKSTWLEHLSYLFLAIKHSTRFFLTPVRCLIWTRHLHNTAVSYQSMKASCMHTLVQVAHLTRQYLWHLPKRSIKDFSSGLTNSHIPLPEHQIWPIT